MATGYSKLEEGRFLLLTEHSITPDGIDESKLPELPDPRLEAGLPLPAELKSIFSRRLLGLPIQEIDPFYYGRETFVVVQSNWKIERFSASKSLWLLGPFNRLRSATVRIVTHWLYRFLAHVAIIIFTFMDSLPIPYINNLWLGFCIVFSVEVFIKVAAYGFLLSPFSYMRNPWNWIDFILTNTGWFVGLTVDRNHIIQPLRSLRLLHMSTLGKLSFNWIFRSVLLLKNVLLYIGFMFVIFTLLGLHTYHGIMQNKCVKNDKSMWEKNVTFQTYKQNKGLHSMDDKWYLLEGQQYLLCGNYTGASQCPNGYTCVPDSGHNPNYGYTNFDNFAWSGLEVARLMSVDLWDSLLLQVRTTLGPWNVIYFLVVVIFGGHLMTNLITAHVAISHGQLLDLIEPSTAIVKPTEQTKEDTKTILAKSSDVNVGASSSSETQPIIVNVSTVDPEEEIDSTAEDDEEDMAMGADGQYEDRNVVERLCLVCLTLFCGWNCCDCCATMRRRLQMVVEHWAFKAVIIVMVSVNFILLMIIHSSEHSHTKYAAENTLRVTVWIFSIEILLKILAYSPKTYLKNSWNVLDFSVIVIVLIVNEGLSMIVHTGNIPINLLVLLRVYHLSKWWPNLSAFVRASGSNTMMLTLVTCVFASIGTRLFEVNYTAFLREHTLYDLPRWTFHSNANSIVTVIRVLCGEWTEPFWECHRINGWSCAPYFMALCIVGNLLVINVFVSMLLRSLQSHNLCDTAFEDNELTLYSSLKQKVQSLRTTVTTYLENRKKPAESTIEEERYATLITDGAAVADSGISETPIAQFTVNLGPDEEADQNQSRADLCPGLTDWYRTTKRQLRPRGVFQAFCENARSKMKVVFENRHCSIAYTVFIVSVCVPLTLEDINFRSGNRATLHIINDVFRILVTVVFLVEVALKFFCYGCPKKWLQARWCRFDLIITLMQLLPLVFFHNTVTGLILISLRPLKLISRVENLRVVMSTLMYEIRHLGDTMLVCLFSWIVMACFCLFIYKDLNFACFEDVDYEEDTGKPFLKFSSDCLFNEHTWINSIVNFNNLGSGLLALLQVAFSKGWLVSSQKSPSGMLGVPSAIYVTEGIIFGVFLIYGVLGCLALIVRTVVKKSNNLKRKTRASSYVSLLMTADQRATFDSSKELFFMKPVKALPPPNPYQCCPGLYEFVSGGRVDVVSAIVLVFNLVSLSVFIHSKDTKKNLQTALQFMDHAFISFFVFETTLKIAVLRKLYFQHGWNIYDLSVHSLSLINAILNMTLSKYFVSPYIFATYFFAILRVIRLVRFIGCVRFVARGLSRLWPAFLNVTMFVSIFATVASLVGMSAFMMAELGEDGLDDHHNFQTFASSLLVTSKMTITAGWMGILVGLLEQGNIFSFFFVTIYLLWSLFVIVQIGTVLLLEFYSDLRSKRHLGITDQILDDFSHTWNILDSDAIGYIPVDTLPDLLHSLPAPFQMERPGALQIALLDLPIYARDRIGHDDLLRTLLRRLDPNGDVTNRSKEEDGEATEEQDGRCSYDVTPEAVTSTLRRYRDEHAVKIQRWWRSKLANSREQFLLG